ncbi:MAG TPA: hypothetical protein VLS96_02360 [Nodosilinea sp.]|nr:hypothetical protein [Nodosilinea sp.]
MSTAMPRRPPFPSPFQPPLQPPLQPPDPTPSPPGTVQVWVGRRPKRLWRWLGLPLALASLGGGLALLGLSFRLGLRLMLDPEALPPALGRLYRSPPLALAPAITLDNLKQQAAAAQQRLGDPIPLGQTGEGQDLAIVPLLTEVGGVKDQPPAIAALALLYRDGPGEPLRAVATLPVEALAPEQVLAPWLNSPQAPTAAPARFALTQVVPLPPPTAAAGTWLTLEGTWQQQGLTLRYGHILHVDHEAQRLTLIAPWSSPTNRPPQWADLDGDGPSDLIIDETVGLEPALRGLRVVAGPGVQPVSWVQVPVNAGAQAAAYQQALRLARGGLWHPAQAHLARLKTALPDRWPPAAEAQLRLAERHGAISRQQAEQDWSTPSQQVLALLIDGRWEAALARLEASPELVPAVLNRLGVDRGRLWGRISTAAALPAPDPAVYVWGGLALKAQQNQPSNQDGATPDWLQRQPVPAAARQRLAKVLTAQAAVQQPGAAGALTESPASPAASVVSTVPAVAAFIGQAQPIAVPKAGYAAPGQSFEAWRGQWYQIDLRAVYQDLAWQKGGLALSATAAPAAVWPAVQAVAQDAPQLLRWASATTGIPAALTVRGLAVTQATPVLLATGPDTTTGLADGAAMPPLVFSAGALLWLDASQSQRPGAAAIAAPITKALFGDQPAPPGLSEVLATLPQHSLDLTGDGQPERVLTWDPAALAQLQDWRVQVDTTAPKTIILSTDNRVLYSDVFAPQTLVALTNPALDGPVGLLVYRAGGYELLAWAAANEQFE